MSEANLKPETVAEAPTAPNGSHEPAAAAPPLAVTATPGPLSSPIPPEGSDIWQMSSEAFRSLTRRALDGELTGSPSDIT